MVASRSDTKRRRRDSSPLDSNPKRTKVHAQRKFAQGVSSLSSLLNLTAVKEKTDKSRSGGTKGSNNAGSQSDVATSGKRALPARGAKKPSIEDMITFLCYRGTSALPPHLAHLNKAPSPEPASLASQNAIENSRSKLGDKTNRDGDKGNIKKPLKTAASSAQKAVTAAQALKRKYQEQRIKKTSVSTLSSKVKPVPLLRTTRSSAGANASLSSKAIPKKVVKKNDKAATPSRKKDSSVKDEPTPKKSIRTPTGKQSSSGKLPASNSQSSGSRGGLRSAGLLSENAVRSSLRKLGSSTPSKKKKKQNAASCGDVSVDSKKLATSLSDFSSEDDQPLVKKHKPLVQVQKLIKKSIANIGRKMKLEPRRSKRGMPVSPISPTSSPAKRTSGGSLQFSNSSSNRGSGFKEEPRASKTKTASVSSKELNGILNRNSSQDQKKDCPVTPKSSSSSRMKKGYVMELVADGAGETDQPVETRSRRGSRDLRDTSTDDKASINLEIKTPGVDSKKKESIKSVDPSKKTSGCTASSKAVNPLLSTSLKSQVELSLSAALKSPPDLRIPASIKRPLTAVGITNPMAIAAAAAVVCKPTKADEKGKSKELTQSKEQKEDIKQKEHSEQLSPKTLKSSKEEDKVAVGQPKARHLNASDSKTDVKKEVKVDRAKLMSPRRRAEDLSDEDTKPSLSTTPKDTKKTRLKIDSVSSKEIVMEDDSKTSRTLRKNALKVTSDEDDASIPTTRGVKTPVIRKNSEDDELKLSSRARRSTTRSSKKPHSSDEDGSNEAQAEGDGGNTKKAIQARKKASSTENESEVDTTLKSSNKKRSTRQPKARSSDDETSLGKANKVVKKPLRSFDEYSSENEESDDLSDSANLTATKPSTRSTAKTKASGRTLPSRLTRSGKKSPALEASLGSRRKHRSKLESNVSSSEDESDSEQSARLPKTRSKTVKGVHNKRGTNTESSTDETDEKSLSQQSSKDRKRSPATKTNVKASRRLGSSDESASSSSEEEDDNKGPSAKSKRKAKVTDSDFKALRNKSKRKEHSNTVGISKDKILSDDDIDGGKVEGDEDEENHELSRRSRSPRRSSRRSVKARTPENKTDSSASDASSSEPSPSRPRRVLRERKGLFSFAEVDPPSDSEEEVIAAAKASLELIGQQQSTDVDSSSECKIAEKAPTASISHDSDNGTKPQVKLKSAEVVKGDKKPSLDASQRKKTLSKKRVKPPSEVQSNLNEELEKTLLSINLSPQMSKSIDKSSGDIHTVFDDSSSLSRSVAPVCPAASTVSLQSCTVETVSVGSNSSSYLKQHVTTPKNSALVPCPPSVPIDPALVVSHSTPPSRGLPLLISQPLLSTAQSAVSGSSLTAAPKLAVKNTPAKYTPLASKAQKPSPGMAFVSTTSISVASTSTSMTWTPAASMSFLQTVSKAAATSRDAVPIAASCSMSTLTTLSAGPVMSSVIGMPAASVSSSAPILAASLPAPMPAPMSAMPMQMSSAMPVSISSASVSAPLSASMALPISAPMSIPLTTQLGIPLQTSVNVPLTVPMSGTMTLPLQVASHSSGTSPGTPFLLPVPSTLTPMLAPGQAVMKKDCGTLGGMPNPGGNAPPLMVGMNPLVVNSNRGAFFLSTGSTMTMTSSQQQMVPGPLMPSLLSLRLPDKPAGQQTIMASSPLYVPFAFGNPGIIQTQGQMQPQIQTMTGVSTITAMATNIQNTMATNIQNTVASNMQNTMATNIQSSVSTNIQNALVTNIQNVPAASVQNSVSTSFQNATSISSAMTLTQTQGTGVGTGMKRQLVLATKNGPVSKLILSVGEDGSHVLAAASPNSISTSDAQTLMSVMQPMKPPGPALNMAVSQNLQTIPSAALRSSPSTIAPKLAPMASKGVQAMPSSSIGAQIMKQQLVSSVPASSSGQVMVNSSPLGTLSSTSVEALISSKCGGSRSPATMVSLGSSATTVTTCSPIISSSYASASVTKTTVLPNVITSSSTSSNITEAHSSFRNAISGGSSVLPDAAKVPATNTVASNRILYLPIPSTRPSVPSAMTTSSSISQLQEKPHASPTVLTSDSSDSMLSKPTGVSSLEPPSSRPLVSRPSMSVTLTGSQKFSTPLKVATPGAPASPARSVGKPVDLKPSVPANVNVVTAPVPTSRIPSAPGALAALKSPSGSPSSTRAIAKTGSSRKPYSSAPSYAAVKTADSAAPVEVISASVSSVSSSPSRDPSIVDSITPPSAAAKSTNNPVTPKLTVPPKVTPAIKPSVSSTPPSATKSSTSPSVSGLSESKRKGTEVELAPTHRTLSMLSTAFHSNKMGKERKRDVVGKRASTVLEMPGSCEKLTEQVNIEKSGLDSLAEIATSLAERSTETSLSTDKRTPQHSLWTNPAQILGKETLKVPGLPITANIGANLPTKNDLAKMKSGAVLADAVDKRTVTDLEKLVKVKGSSTGTDTEKPSVSGLLTSSKADTPRQKVQKWLDDGSKGDVEHKANCSFLNNGNSCTCDVMEEDISNLNSLAEVCVSMERINSPVKDQKPVKQGNKSAAEKKNKQDAMETSKKNSQSSSSPAKSSLPLNSHQMKVTWQNAFGVKSPSRNIKSTASSQAKRTTSAEDTKTSQASASDLLEKNKTSITDKSDQSIQEAAPTLKNEQCQNKIDASSSSSGFADESPQGKKSTQRRSLLGRLTDQPHPKLDTNAFSADNESSVYAFEAEKDTPPVSQPFRRRSKTSSRSDEEDSTSIGSISNTVAVHVSKDAVIVPIQVETDENSLSVVSAKMSSEKNGIGANTSPDDGSDVYYIPLGHEDDVRAVAVRLGKEGPNNRVVMSAKLVKKPPTFKHPNDTNDEGPNKRAKIEASSAQSSHSSAMPCIEQEASTSNVQSCSDAKTASQGSVNDSKTPHDRHKQNQRDLSRYSAADSSSEDTSSLINMPTSSKGTRDSRNSMSPSSSRNRSPMSDKASPPASQNNRKSQGRFNRQSSIDSDASEKAKSIRRGSKSKSVSSRASPSPSLPSTSSTSSGPSRPSQKSNRSYNGPVPGNVSEAPVFHPTEKEFQDPYAYIEKIRPIAEKYGLCRIVAPNSFKPDCNVEDDIRFTADNQYVHKMMDRWGPNAKEMRAIVKYIAQHNIHLKHAPLVGGMELDLPRLYTTVQNFGGLMEVMDKKRWVKVAETMRIPKSAQDRASKLDEVYCKCLLPYETLKTGERDNLFEMVEVEWEMRKERRDKRLAASAALPDQSESASQQDEEDEEEEEEEEDDEEDECIVKGRSMPLTTFYRTARNTTHMWFKGNSPSASEVEHEFWRHVKDRNFHICVNAGSVDCSDPPYGFPTRNSPFAKHPWNLKVLSNNSGSILRSLGSVIGVTVPTLHFGMVFTTCCWYRDPHGLPWIEYLHTGAKKIWYGIPEHGGEKFRAAMQEVAPHYVRKKALWLASDTAMVPPTMLTERKVPLCRTVQEPGQFIVVFPRAHTSSVATGYIVSESVSFAPPNWLPSAMDSFKEMQKCNEPPLFSLDKLIFSIAEDPRTSLNVLNKILPSAMEILEREITYQQGLKKKGINSSERIERTKKKSSGKKVKVQKEADDMEVMECEVCSTNLYLSMVVNSEDDTGYCLVHASQYLEEEKLDPSQCKLLYAYSQNELHEFCQNLLDRIEAKTGKKGINFSSNNSDSGSSASTSTRT